jgi:hypothetical protein
LLAEKTYRSLNATAPLRSSLPQRSQALIESHITKGAFIRLPIDIFGVCATIEPSKASGGNEAQTVHPAAMDEQKRVECARTLP